MFKIACSIGLVLLLAGCSNREPPGGDFRKLSTLADFPDFYPGLGRLYVQPASMPFGPYYGYDRNGKLVCTIYMAPMAAMDAHQSLEDLIQGAPALVDHVQMLYTHGHPGVAEPHYHVILWHITQREQSFVR